jgi:hypothetical protein
MATPKTVVPPVSPDALSEPLRTLLRQFIQALYAEGYEQGVNDTVARILLAASPPGNEQASHHPQYDDFPSGKVTSSSTEFLPSETRILVDSVLLWAGPRGATATEIWRSPTNTHGASRSGISKVLVRGFRKHQYVSTGKGRYSLNQARADK